MEVENRERLRQARTGFGVMDVESLDKEHNNDLHVREQEMLVQADELARRRTGLQQQLEGLTGRQYPLPETYWNAEVAVEVADMPTVGLDIHIDYPGS